MQIRLPSPTEIKDQDLRNYVSKLVQALERALAKLPETPFTKDRIVVTNLTKQYTLDATAGTLGDVRFVLGTLLRDLQDSGKVA